VELSARTTKAKFVLLIILTSSLAYELPVQAQSSVTLYGLLDAGISYSSNNGGKKLYQFADGVYTGNRWGMTGVEDLGGGTRAVFKLESGFTLGTGKALGGGAAFSRQAYAGLSDNTYGTLTFGLQYDFINDYAANDNVSGDVTGYGSHQGDYDRMGTDRLPNAVKYVSPNIHGFSFGGMYSFSNTAGDFYDGSGWSAGGNYSGGPLQVGLAYTRLNGTTTDPFAKIGFTSFLGQRVATVNPNTGAVTDLYSSSNFRLDYSGALVLAGAYQLGPARIIANVTRTTFKADGVTSSMWVGEAGTIYNITPALQAVGGYQYTTFEGAHWHQLAAGLTYHLSKATFVYGGFDYLRASSGVYPVIGGHFTPSTSDNQSDARIAILHKF
jgi:outer membrane protein OmpU